MENRFDLLMENASHSLKILGDSNLRSRWGNGCSVGGHNCSGREQKSESTIHYLIKAFLPSAHWWSLE